MAMPALPPQMMQQLMARLALQNPQAVATMMASRGMAPPTVGPAAAAPVTPQYMPQPGSMLGAPGAQPLVATPQVPDPNDPMAKIAQALSAVKAPPAAPVAAPLGAPSVPLGNQSAPNLMAIMQAMMGRGGGTATATPSLGSLIGG